MTQQTDYEKTGKSVRAGKRMMNALVYTLLTLWALMVLLSLIHI